MSCPLERMLITTNAVWEKSCFNWIRNKPKFNLSTSTKIRPKIGFLACEAYVSVAVRHDPSQPLPHSLSEEGGWDTPLGKFGWFPARDTLRDLLYPAVLLKVVVETQVTFWFKRRISRHVQSVGTSQWDWSCIKYHSGELSNARILT